MQIEITIERLHVRLEIQGESEMADVFTRIALAVAALQAGDNAALQSHVRDIDAHLTNLDDEVLGLQSDDTSSKNRLDAIEAGIGKIADAFDGGASAPSGDGTAANPGGGSNTGATSGTGADAGNPGGSPLPGAQDGTGESAGNPGGSADPAPVAGDASGSDTADQGAIPASGAGMETHGQVDTPVTTG